MVTAASAGAEASNATRHSTQTRSIAAARTMAWLYIKPPLSGPLEPGRAQKPMLTARKDAPARLLTAAELRRSGSVLIAAGTGVGRAIAVETVCIAPSTARTAV